MDISRITLDDEEFFPEEDVTFVNLCERYKSLSERINEKILEIQKKKSEPPKPNNDDEK